MADIGPGDLPGQRKPVGKPVGNPVRGKFGGQKQIESAGFLAEAARLDWLDPLAVQLLTQILAQTLADISPVGGQIERFLLSPQPSPFGGLTFFVRQFNGGQLILRSAHTRSRHYATPPHEFPIDGAQTCAPHFAPAARKPLLESDF